jgi:hypothetical protein
MKILVEVDYLVGYRLKSDLSSKQQLWWWGWGWWWWWWGPGSVVVVFAVVFAVQEQRPLRVKVETFPEQTDCEAFQRILCFWLYQKQQHHLHLHYYWKWNSWNQ